MKKRVFVLTLAVAAFGFGLAGCTEEKPCASMDKTKQVMGTCPGCAKKAPVGTYCPKCKAVAVEKVKTYTCKKCKKKVKEGTWCKKHNCFRFEHPEMKCPKSGKKVMKGQYCKKCSGYHGLPMVMYDAKKKEPCVRKKSCDK